MFYNEAEDYYVCPIGQHMNFIGNFKSVSDLGYVSVISKYRSQDCSKCPMRGKCHKGKSDRREIEVNHQANAFKLKSNRKVKVEFGLVATAHNIRKLIAVRGAAKLMGLA